MEELVVRLLQVTSGCLLPLAFGSKAEARAATDLMRPSISTHTLCGL